MTLYPKPGVPGTFIDDETGQEIKLVDWRSGTQEDTDQMFSQGDRCNEPCESFGENVKCNLKRGHAGEHMYWRAW